MTDREAPPRAMAPDLPSRWDGVLTEAQKQWCERHEIELAYDPLQIGWVIAQDDTLGGHAASAAPLSWCRMQTTGLFGFRRWQPEDLPTYMRLLDDPDLWRYMKESWPGPLTRDLARDLMDISGLTGHHDVRAAMSQDGPVGQMRLAFGVDPSCDNTAEISYWLGRDYWGRGLGRALVREATRHAFAEHDWLYRLVAFVHPENPASARCLRAAGYHDRGHRDDGWSCFVIYRDS